MKVPGGRFFPIGFQFEECNSTAPITSGGMMKESQSQQKDVSSHLSQIEDIIRPNFAKNLPKDCLRTTMWSLRNIISCRKSAIATQQSCDGPGWSKGGDWRVEIPWQNTTKKPTQWSPESLSTFSVLTTGPNFHNLRKKGGCGDNLQLLDASVFQFLGRWSDDLTSIGMAQPIEPWLQDFVFSSDSAPGNISFWSSR